MYYIPLPIIAPANDPCPRAVRSGVAGEARPLVILHACADVYGCKIGSNFAAFCAETFSTAVHPYYPIDGCSILCEFPTALLPSSIIHALNTSTLQLAAILIYQPPLAHEGQNLAFSLHNALPSPSSPRHTRTHVHQSV